MDRSERPASSKPDDAANPTGQTAQTPVSPTTGPSILPPGALANETGRFRVVTLHASGGMGNVFVAKDDQLNRSVALKEIRELFADDQQIRDRFLREAEVTGQLEHPGIVPVYALGHYADGRPYYVMRMIRGDSLKQAIAALHRNHGSGDEHASRLELRRLLNRFVTACNTIEYAHSRGVVHRDIKPDNIMLGPYGETLVVDWGLAKLVRSSDVQIDVPAGDDRRVSIADRRHAGRHDHGDPCVHESGAGPRMAGRHQTGLGRLQPGSDALHAADRPAADQRERPRRSPGPHPETGLSASRVKSIRRSRVRSRPSASRPWPAR